MEDLQFEGINYDDLHARNFKVTKPELAQIVHRTQAATEAKKTLEKLMSFQPHDEVYKRLEEAVKVVDQLIIARALLKVVADDDIIL